MFPMAGKEIPQCNPTKQTVKIHPLWFKTGELLLPQDFPWGKVCLLRSRNLFIR